MLFASLAVVMFANCEAPITKKECGIIVFKDADGHGLASAPTDLPYSDWNVAKQACEDLVLDGCSDWRLPTKEELNQLYLNEDKIGGFGKFDSLLCALSHLNVKLFKLALRPIKSFRSLSF